MIVLETLKDFRLLKIEPSRKVLLLITEYGGKDISNTLVSIELHVFPVVFILLDSGWNTSVVAGENMVDSLESVCIL